MTDRKNLGKFSHKKKIILLVLVAIAIGGGYIVGQKVNAPSVEQAAEQVSESATEQTAEPQEETKESFDINGALSDVTNGASIQGVQFTGISSGEAMARFDGRYKLVAAFKNLPSPVGGSFYEGWVVRKGAANSVISTGRVTEKNGYLVNEFSADQNLNDHTFYVLTLEPNDGDPAPADHILEGTMQ